MAYLHLKLSENSHELLTSYRTKNHPFKLEYSKLMRFLIKIPCNKLFCISY